MTLKPGIPPHRIGIASVSNLWEDIDRKRVETGGWWANMQTLRLRVYSGQSPDHYAVLELNINEGRIFGVRVTGDGNYLLRAGTPQVFMLFPEFFNWLMGLEDLKFPPDAPDSNHDLKWEVWTPIAPIHNVIAGTGGVWFGSHHGLQRAIYLILGAFTR